MDFPHGEDYNSSSEYPASLFVGEYTLLEQLRSMAAIAETFDVLYPQLRDTDFRKQVPRLEVPVFVVRARTRRRGARPSRASGSTVYLLPARSTSSSTTPATLPRTTSPAGSRRT